MAFFTPVAVKRQLTLHTLSAMRNPFPTLRIDVSTRLAAPLTTSNMTTKFASSALLSLARAPERRPIGWARRGWGASALLFVSAKLVFDGFDSPSDPPPAWRRRPKPGSLELLGVLNAEERGEMWFVAGFAPFASARRGD